MIDVPLLEPVQYLRNNSAKKAKLAHYRQVLSKRSVFFQSCRHFSTQANDRSTTQRWGITAQSFNNMPFDIGDLFARIIAFASCAIRILDALGISDAETRFDAAPLSESD